MLVLIYTKMMVEAFLNNSKQEEKSQLQYVDPFSMGPYKLSDLSFEMAIFSVPPLREEIGHYRAVQTE